MIKCPEVSPVALELFFLHRIAYRNRQQFGNRPGQLLLLQPWIGAGRTPAKIHPGVDTVVIDAISIERAHCQNDHLKSVQTKTARFPGLPLQEYKQMKL